MLSNRSFDADTELVSFWLNRRRLSEENAKDWLPQHFKPGRKDLRRRYFMGEA